MQNSHHKLLQFYEEEVRLGIDRRRQLAGYRDINLERLRAGLDKLGPLRGSTTALFERHCDQGSYAMHTLNQHAERDYDIDTAVIFRADALPSSPLDARKRVAQALLMSGTTFVKEPEARTNAVTVWYAEGHHVDLAVYRQIKSVNGTRIEHAGVEWTRRSPTEITEWFTGAVAGKSPPASTDGTLPAGQLRRVVRLLKAFARSRPSWSLPGGMVVTTLAEECYRAHYSRDDVALYDTMVAVRDRLKRNVDVNNPVDYDQALTTKEEHLAQVGRFRDRLDDIIKRLAPLFAPGCSDAEAARAWNWVFRHAFWGDIETEAVEHGKAGVVRLDLTAGVAFEENGKIRYLYRDHQQLPKKLWLRFSYSGFSAAASDRVCWIVNNTGDEAAAKKQLRFELEGETVWRLTAYKGIHTMTCEIRSGDRVVARGVHRVRIGARLGCCAHPSRGLGKSSQQERYTTMAVKKRSRDDFKEDVRREIELRVASVCSKPGCGRVTRGPHSDGKRSVNLGEAGHITAASEGGPRYDAKMGQAERVAASNGVWLCRVCHRFVDVDESPFDVDTLRRWKHEAEARAHEAIDLGKHREGMPRLITVLHRSMEMIANGSLERSLPLLFRGAPTREVVVDQCELYQRGALVDPLDAIRRQVKTAAHLRTVIEDAPGAELAYYGIAHVPLAFHFGFLLSTRISVHYAERDRDADLWHWLGGGQEFPPLTMVKPADDDLAAEDIVVRVSVSYEVSPSQSEAIVSSRAAFDLRLDWPALDVVRSHNQIAAYSRAFREILDEVAARRSVRRVHVFAATPMSLSFALGRQVRGSVHPDVYVYNYRRADEPQYRWAALLSDDICRADIVRLAGVSPHAEP